MKDYALKMIFNFINTSSYSGKKSKNFLIFQVIFLLFFSLSFITACQSNGIQASPSEKIEISCKKEYGCNVDVIFETKKINIFKNYPFEPSVKWFSEKVAEIELSCGDPCKNSIFVDFSQEKISDPYENVLSVQISKNVFVSAVKNKIFIRKIFNDSNKQIIIDRNFSPVASLPSAIEEIKFVNSTSLYMRYLKGNSFETVEEFIPFELDELE